MVVPRHCRLDIDGRVVRAERGVQAHADPVFARQFIAEPDAAGDDCLGAVKAFEIVPRRAAAHEAHQAEALPELPAQLGLDLCDLLALIAHDRRPPQADEGPQVERRVAKTRRAVTAQAEIQLFVQRNELHGDELHALKLVVSPECLAEEPRRDLDERAAVRREDVVSRIIREGWGQPADVRLVPEVRPPRRPRGRVECDLRR
jgi:hypothetical protein